MITLKDLKHRVSAYLRENAVTPSGFGAAALNDPHFVFDLRKGRAVLPATRQRVVAYIDTQIAAKAAQELAADGKATGQKPRKKA